MCCCPLLPISYSLHHPQSSIIVVVVCCCCGHPLSLPHHVIVVHLSPLLSHSHCCVLSSTPKVTEGKGVMWQWLGVLWWLFVVAVMVGVCEWLMTVVGGGGCRWWQWWGWEDLCFYSVRSSVWLWICLVTNSSKDQLRLVRPVFCQFWQERKRTIMRLLVLG